MIKHILFILPILFCFTALAQTGTVTDSSGQVVLRMNGPSVLSADGKVVFTVRGNLVFEGESDKKKHIVLMINSTDIFSKKAGNVLDKDNDQVYGLYEGAFYLGNRGMEDRFMIGYYTDGPGSTKLTLPSGEVLATVSGEVLTNGMLVAVFHYMNRELDLDEAAKNVMADIIIQEEASRGIIKRMWNAGDDEFVWDGYVLKRRFNSFDYEEWTFDGTTLKRLWYSNSTEYTWDGTYLKSRWGSANQEFVWDGRSIKSRFGTGDNEYIIQGNVVKPMWDSTGDKEWELNGNIPVPVIALVVFELLSK